MYIAADDEVLSKHVRASLNQMLQGRIDGEAHIIAQVDAPKVKTKRYSLSGSGSLNRHIVGTPVQNINAGSPRQLKSFLKWGIQGYPADHYAIIVWGHGTGLDDPTFWQASDLGMSKSPSRAVEKFGMELTPIAPGLQRPGVARNVLLNAAAPNSRFHRQTASNPSLRLATLIPSVQLRKVDRQLRRFAQIAIDGKHYISNPQLRKALEAAQRLAKGRVAVFGTDACVMSMVELCYEFRCVPLMIASEAGIPLQSWPYRRILHRLKKDPAMSPRSLATTIVNEFAGYYDGTRSDTTLSAFNLKQPKSLKKAIDKLAAQLTIAMGKPDSRAEIFSSRQAAQGFENVVDYVDLYDFCRLLRRRKSSVLLRRACTEVMKAIKGIVLRSKHSGNAYARAYGLSIYFPRWLLATKGRSKSNVLEMKKVEKAISGRYAELQFAKQTKWDEFLRRAVQTTQVALPVPA